MWESEALCWASGDNKLNKIQPYPLRNSSLDREMHNSLSHQVLYPELFARLWA